MALDGCRTLAKGGSGRCHRYCAVHGVGSAFRGFRTAIPTAIRVRGLQSPETRSETSSPSVCRRCSDVANNAFAQFLGFPLPSVYGIYAVSGGRLHELEALVG